MAGPTASGRNALAPVPRGLIYSPGYTAFARAERQVLTIHDLIHLHVPWPGRIKYLMFYNLVTKPVIRRTGSVVTVSETSKRAIEHWLDDASVDVVNAGLGVSAAFHPNVTPAKSTSPYLLYVGNLRAHKNFRTALAALKLVPGAELRALLPAAEHEATRKICDELGILSRVTLLPSLGDDELARQYRGAAATVMPSTLEGFGLPPLESIMTGTPVIYWDGCEAVAETVSGHGWPVQEPYAADAWAARFESALASPQRVRPPSQMYDWDATARTIDATLQSLIR